MYFKVLVVALLVSMTLALPKVADVETTELEIPVPAEESVTYEDAPEEVAPEAVEVHDVKDETPAPAEVKDETPAPAEVKDKTPAPAEGAEVADHGEDEEEEGEGEGGYGYGSAWRLQASNICFLTKGDKPGFFKLKQGGELVAMKLQHKSGVVSCIGTTLNSNFGCNNRAKTWYSYRHIGTFVTDDVRNVIFPAMTKIDRGFATLPGYNAHSKFLVFTNYATPMLARRGQDVKIWYGEDLFDIFEGDNQGRTCVDVYAKFR